MKWFRRRDTRPPAGPYDVRDAPDDGIPRLDLGSVRLPVPDGDQIQIEMDQEFGAVRAVHVQTSFGQCTVSAFAAPPDGGMWHEVSEDLRGDPTLHVEPLEFGAWGREIVVVQNDHIIRFIGIDGPRWMVRGVAASPEGSAEQNASALRELLRGTVVVRGDDELPDRTPLPITLPDEIAKHIQ